MAGQAPARPLGTVAATRTAGRGDSSAAALSAGYATAFIVGAAIFLATAILGALALPARLNAPGPTPAAIDIGGFELQQTKKYRDSNGRGAPRW